MTPELPRGGPGCFAGATSLRYGLAIPLIALLTLIGPPITPARPLSRLVLLASALCVPLIPWLWTYSRVIGICFHRDFDPDGAPDGPAPGAPADVQLP